MRHPETLLLSAWHFMTDHWRARGVRRQSDVPAVPIKAGRQTLYFTDENGSGILVPIDPKLLCERHAAAIERLRCSVGNARLFTQHVLPVIFGWAAMVQALPRQPRGCWSNTDGLFEAGLAMALGTLLALDAHVIAPDLPPARRTERAERLRVAAVIVGMLSDVQRLARIRLMAVDTDDNGRERLLETFSPALETALAFGTRHVGQTLQMHRYLDDEVQCTLSTLPLDVLRQLLPATTERWLAASDPKRSDTPLSAIKCTLTFKAGVSEAEQLLTSCLAKGRAWAINRKERANAAIEGQAPVLSGFAELFEAALRLAIKEGDMVPNRAGSPLVFAADGVYLKWPSGFVDLLDRVNALFDEFTVPDEADVISTVLATAGVTSFTWTGQTTYTYVGKPLFRSWDENVSFIKLQNGRVLEDLARFAADRQGKALPARLAPLFPRQKKRLGKADTTCRHCWQLNPAPAGFNDAQQRAYRRLSQVVDEINRRDDALQWSTPLGLFIPLAFFGGLSVPEIIRLLGKTFLAGRALMPSTSILKQPRFSYVYSVRVGSMASAAMKAMAQKSVDDQDGIAIEGVIVRLLCIRPVAIYDDDDRTQTDCPWPDRYRLTVIEPDPA